MQKIFYNANIVTFDSNLPTAEAFLVNDGNIVLVGKNDEVLEMKNDETEVFDLGGKTIIPSFYDTNAKIYSIIENRLKTANKEQFLENNDEIDENYDKFDNFEIYKEEFLIIQKEYLHNGITTVFEMGVNNKEFIFWKKLSEAGQLLLDVIVYIDIITSKDVMDNNCRSYRKYKNHLRVGGYIIRLDGKLSEKKSWLSKKYKNEKTYKGYTLVGYEQLSVLIKAALDEKKQMVVEANGDESLSQFMNCFEENLKDKSEEDKFRPIAKNCNLASKKQIKDMKNLGISPSFEINEIEKSGQKFIKSLGIFRSKRVQPVKDFADNGVSFILGSSMIEVPNIFKLIDYAVERKISDKKVLGKKQTISFEVALASMIKSSAYFAFDNNFKGSIENGYRADFTVLNYDLNQIKNHTLDMDKTSIVSEVYVGGDKVV